MMKFVATSAVALSLSVTTAVAGEFSEGSQAKEWGLLGEETATFSGKVVDIICELGGDCADSCGDGDRQLGIVRASDGVMLPVLKNRQSSFNGAVADLMPYCNQDVDVDGLLVGEAEIADFGRKVFMIQFIRAAGSEEWVSANNWTKDWSARHPEHDGKGPWFRRDPRVAAQIEATGHFGLGAEVDQQYIEENN